MKNLLMEERHFRNEKRIKYLILVVFGFLILSIMINSCISIIRPGYVGVVIDMLGDKKGMENKEIHVGMHILPPWKNVYQFPIFEQNTTWEKADENFDFQTSEGMAVSADVGITYHLRPENIPYIFQRYRRGMDEITNVFIRNYIRDAINKAACKTKIEDLYSGKEFFFEEVENHVRDYLSPMGIELSRIYLIGRFHFPENVIKALNAKIEANQRAQQRENELREAEAEAKKQVAKAEGEARSVMVRTETEAKAHLLLSESKAKANLMLSSSLTNELIKWQSVQKWDGKLPQMTGGIVPFVKID